MDGKLPKTIWNVQTFSKPKNSILWGSKLEVLKLELGKALLQFNLWFALSPGHFPLDLANKKMLL